MLFDHQPHLMHFHKHVLIGESGIGAICICTVGGHGKVCLGHMAKAKPTHPESAGTRRLVLEEQYVILQQEALDKLLYYE